MRLHLWLPQLAALAIVIGGCGRVQGNEGVTKMTVYYFPIGAETLTPITSASIQERGRHCEIRSGEDIGKIKKVLHDATKPASQKFSDKKVRVKIFEASSDSDRLLAIVENEGEVRFSDGTEGQISRRGLDILKKIIESQCKQ